MRLYKAIGTDRADPDKLGRIKVKCQQLVGAEQELPMWVAPMLPYRSQSGAGFWAVPEIDTVVDLLELDDGTSMGEYSEAYLDNAQYRYVPGEFSPAHPPEDTWQGNYPDRYGWSDPDGNAIVFDSADHTVSLVHGSGKCSILLENDGTVTIKGAAIKIDENASKWMVRGDPLKTLLDNWYSFLTTHTHNYNPGPSPPAATTPPNPPSPNSVPGDLLSTKHKVE